MGQLLFDEYSADVEIFLLVDGKRYDVAQIGSGSLILRKPAPLPPGTDARLFIRIDAHEEVTPILLTEGADVDSRPIPFF
ncbi:MAG TPA: hypothetical protein VG713_01220 [Pirellulales bacterium]|nr:hypothetical protein [Pirellulales bacterium]